MIFLVIQSLTNFHIQKPRVLCSTLGIVAIAFSVIFLEHDVNHQTKITPSKAFESVKTRMKNKKNSATTKRTSSLVNRGTFVTFGLLVLATCFGIFFERFGLDPFNELYSPGSAQIEEVNSIYNDIDQAVKPFSGDNFNLEQIFGDKPIWGTLNSGHYFGLKTSVPDSIETSLAWFKNELSHEGLLSIRHLCDQNDQIKSYSWIRHDFHSFGEQVVDDNGYRLKTSFIKHPDDVLSWQAKIDIEAIDKNNSQLAPLSVIQYVTTNKKDDHIKLVSNSESLKGQKIFSISGHSTDIGDFEMSIDYISEPGNFLKASYLVDKFEKLRLPVSSFLHSRMSMMSFKGRRIFILPGRAGFDDRIEPNLIACQVIIKAPASLMISWNSLNSEKSQTEVAPLEYQNRLEKKIEKFDENFDRIFRIKPPEGLGKHDLMKLARVALSNMVGSVGYFYGVSFIGASTESDRITRYGPIQLLTGVPSRSFFPRGFLWDEGFHNLLISEWDSKLSNSIIESWFNIMNINGWIPREVILGIESMRRVPREFIIQRITNANPPSMFIAIERMLDRNLLQESTLKSIYPKLKAWYTWFNRTQSGMKHSTFRWRGRDELSVSMLNPKTLTSGLDDYPRASHPSQMEYHVDLRCWLALASRTLVKLARKRNDLEYLAMITRDAVELNDNKLLEELHWSEQHRMFCDFGHDADKAELVWVTKTRPSKSDKSKMETYQVLERHTSSHQTFRCVPEFGYVSLFPMLMKILDPHSDKLGIILEKLRDKNEVWSDFGIRSLSKSSRYYGKYNTEHDKPYWRGAVWLNINYLILSSLEHYSKLDGPYREKCSNIFLELKENLSRNVLNEFARTNYIWENYDDLNGQGRGSHPFTGWSSLILLILSSNL